MYKPTECVQNLCAHETNLIHICIILEDLIFFRKGAMMINVLFNEKTVILLSYPIVCCAFRSCSALCWSRIPFRLHVSCSAGRGKGPGLDSRAVNMLLSHSLCLFAPKIMWTIFLKYWYGQFSRPKISVYVPTVLLLSSSAILPTP